MIADIKGNEEAKKIIKNELIKGKVSGTYLFYGRKGADLFEFALAFAKGLNCPEIKDDFCGECRICRNIEKKVYSDLHIITDSDESIKIDRIRELIKNASETSYEGRKKVFIVEGINRIRREAGNALLKIIEEPPKDTFFILLAESLNILPTIKSRAISIEIKALNHEELGVEREVYDFFVGNVKDIKTFLNEKISLKRNLSYEDLPVALEEYVEKGDLASKADLIWAVEDYLKNLPYLDELEKIYFAEEMDRVVGKNREVLKELVYIFMIKAKNIKNLEELLTLKDSINYNVNINLTLVNFMLCL